MPKLKENNNERKTKVAKSLCRFEKGVIKKYLNISHPQSAIRNPQSLLVAGVDEAGRGALAGPVVAGAVILSLSCDLSPDKWIGINDSKKLQAKERKKILPYLQKNCVRYAIGVVPPKTIDKKNILNATFLAMKKAISALGVSPDLILIDGNYTLPISLPQIAVKQGDAKCISIAAASVVAKTARDEIMEKEHKKYPEFNFLKNKGYGTPEHFLSLKRYGNCKIHRKSFTQNMG